MSERKEVPMHVRHLTGCSAPKCIQKLEGCDVVKIYLYSTLKAIELPNTYSTFHSYVTRVGISWDDQRLVGEEPFHVEHLIGETTVRETKTIMEGIPKFKHLKAKLPNNGVIIFRNEQSLPIEENRDLEVIEECSRLQRYSKGNWNHSLKYVSFTRDAAWHVE